MKNKAVRRKKECSTADYMHSHDMFEIKLSYS